MPSKKKDDVIIQPNKLTLEPFKKAKSVQKMVDKINNKEK